MLIKEVFILRKVKYSNEFKVSIVKSYLSRFTLYIALWNKLGINQKTYFRVGKRYNLLVDKNFFDSIHTSSVYAKEFKKFALKIYISLKFIYSN